ncbi:hypothetical protein BT96DRAFT_701370 [Gymnopus androsaceus JB14]|uniref:Uncharacterized protein n=1 Tax=Gymnopus androsaceus JB14 TaxID=1447944 RepID=A0A6A4IGW9_9AGAR|nr:hypothetical protein BT96DRAFT_701370 [Gymnopus androsaceus JB14]
MYLGARLVLRQVISYTPEYSILMKHFQSCQTNDGHESGSGTGTCRYTRGNTHRYLTCGSRYLFPMDPAQVTGHPLGYF